MKIEIAAPHQVDAIWRIVGTRFNEAAQKYGEDITAGELWQMCRSGNAFLVVAVSGTEILLATVVRFERWGPASVLRVVALVGDRVTEWAADFEEFAVSMARDNGATQIVAEGREGWPKIFKHARKLRSSFVMEI